MTNKDSDKLKELQDYFAKEVVVLETAFKCDKKFVGIDRVAQHMKKIEELIIVLRTKE